MRMGTTRPATLQLDQVPYSVSSTPDGACLLVTQAQGSDLAVTAYHWSTFGSTEGTLLDLGPLSVQNGHIITSLISRTAVHFVVLDFEEHACRSHALDITRKVTEFTFKRKGARGSSARQGSGNAIAHNCLIDCHAEVWTRFPVVAAVQRETISSSSLRSARTLVFVTDRDYPRYTPHFTEMILTFEKATKKPTGDVLRSIQVTAAAFSVFADELCGAGERQNSAGGRAWNVSAYRAGEWLVDFLCLIPIHLALTKENRFVPLKDGVSSPELERSLLGADVNRIVDTLSFGWYESLFQSYMASKVCIVAPISTKFVFHEVMIACEGGVFDGGTVGWEEFCIESPRRYIICWIGYADDRGRVDVGYTYEGCIDCCPRFRRSVPYTSFPTLLHLCV